MGASRFVGRVGGLAVALGVGAAAFAGSGVAWAETPDSDSASASGQSRTGDAAAPSRGRKVATKASGSTAQVAPRQQRNARPDSAASLRVSPPAVQVPTAKPDTEDVPDALPAPSAATTANEQSPASLAVAPAAAEPVEPVAPAVAVIEPTPAPAPEPAPADEVSAFLSEADGGVSDGAGTDPLMPVESPLEWALLAFARRQPLSAASTANPVALVTSSQEVSSNGLVVDPSVEFVDGIVQGALNATSSRGAALTYTFLDSSNGGKLDLGTVPISPSATDPQSYTILPYATWLEDGGGAKGTEQFRVRVREVTDFDQFLINIPLIGLVAAPVIDLLQTLPLIGDLLAPIIGATVVATIDVDLTELAPGPTPLAFTYKVTSFDGTKISTNFFPAAGITAVEEAPLVLNGPGLGSPGATDPYALIGTEDYTIGIRTLRENNYNVITWDPRGEFASGGVLQLDNPFFEGRDASAIISWAAENPLVELEEPGDPKVGMVGGSYGGGIQLVTASTDSRVDAIVPAATWNSLVEALYPSETFKSAWANILLLYLVSDGARINNQIYEGVITGDLLGWISQTSQAVLASSGPTSLLNQLKAPTLLIQGTVDALFNLQQSVANAETIMANPWDTPVKMIWACTGHGACLTGANPGQRAQLFGDTLAWLDTYVAGIGDPAEDIAEFRWYDQKGATFTSDLMPFEPGFNLPDPYTATGDGGLLGIVPFLGGSGPLPDLSWPSSFIFGTPAGNAINVAVTPDLGDRIVGAPELSFTYRGLGTTRSVFAQLVDNATGLVVGNIVTPVPVDLDGREHTVSIPMSDITYTVGAGDSLTLQITSSATLFANGSFGLMDISDIQLDLPIKNPLT